MTNVPIILYMPSFVLVKRGSLLHAFFLKKDISSMERIQNCTFGKIFIVKQQEIIKECRNAFKFYNHNQIIKSRQLQFIAKLLVSNNIICRLISYI